MRINNLFKSKSHLPISARVTIATLMIFISFILLLVVVSNRVLESGMTEGISLQQQAATSLLGIHVAEHVALNLRALEAVAEKIDAQLLLEPQALQRLLKAREIESELFNAGMYVINRDGFAVATVPENIRRLGVKYGDREYFQAALSTGRPAIGKPVQGRVLGDPVIIFAVPVKNADGVVIAVLAGAVDLSMKNFFDKITDSKYGESGYFLVVDRKNRMIITSTRGRFVMEDLDPSRPLTSKLIAGEDITGVEVNPAGVEVFVSSRHVSGTDWSVVASLPVFEAFAPIKEAGNLILKMTILLGLLTAIFTWLGTRRELSPLDNALKKVTAFMQTDAKWEPLPISRQDEIGRLIESFNTLVAKLDEREEELTESEFRWMFAIEGLENGLWDWNLNSGKVFYSQQWKAMLGYADQEIGDSLDEWKSRIHPEDIDAVLEALNRHIRGETEIYRHEYRVRCRNGHYIWIFGRGMVVNRDEHGQPKRMIGTHTDITQRKSMEEQVRQFAFNDALTGLPNRRLLHDRFDRAMSSSKRSGDYCGLILLDLDKFKPLNDEHGHEAGDLLLVEVARRLKDSVREIDTVARIGGDEFVVLLVELGTTHDAAQHNALQVAEKIRISIAAPYQLKLGGRPARMIKHRCTTSMGLVIFTANGSSKDELLRLADTRMYAAKESGRNRVVYGGT